MSALARQFLVIILLMTLTLTVCGTRKCAWVRGVVRCNKDPGKQMNVEVRLYDRDGIGLLRMFDPDDLMGITFTDKDGSFQLDGCGDDFNWLPGIPNLPDPFVRIHHMCNSNQGETLDLPEFHTFVPETHDLGEIFLDHSPYEEANANSNNKAHGSPVVTVNKKSNEILSPISSVPVVQIADVNKNKEKYDVKSGGTGAKAEDDGDLLMKKLKDAAASDDIVELQLDSEDTLS